MLARLLWKHLHTARSHNHHCTDSWCLRLCRTYQHHTQYSHLLWVQPQWSLWRIDLLRTLLCTLRSCCLRHRTDQHRTQYSHLLWVLLL